MTKSVELSFVILGDKLGCDLKGAVSQPKCPHVLQDWLFSCLVEEDQRDICIWSVLEWLRNRLTHYLLNRSLLKDLWCWPFFLVTISSGKSANHERKSTLTPTQRRRASQPSLRCLAWTLQWATAPWAAPQRRHPGDVRTTCQHTWTQHALSPGSGSW